MLTGSLRLWLNMIPSPALTSGSPTSFSRSRKQSMQSLIYVNFSFGIRVMKISLNQIISIIESSPIIGQVKL